ncbi:MAG TPA: carbamoyl phosphate synthase small subunit [Lentisphaeria bacterium]|nr:MAG: carbamoyl phosphate synthase small subunit [Lentisphaerae bacterium GWF2_38_69]HBM15715.1 carbamoyl phosphate synthase small subunit [Lentisphaeria bacterium]
MQKTDWKKLRAESATLALEDGTILKGYSFGARKDMLGELVFNTGMSGYQEIISDPSYAGQIVAMTYPEIGNTGINSSDYESTSLFLSGFIVHNINQPSNWRCDKSLQELLMKEDIPAISGIDTRFLTHLLRSKGTQKAFIHCSDEIITEEDCVKKAKEWEGLDGQDYASKVSCKDAYDFDNLEMTNGTYWGLSDSEILPQIEYNIVAYDYGIKWNILRGLRLKGIGARVVPAQTSAEEIVRLKPDGVFFSNGPADPAAVTYAIENAKKLIGKVPIMGICLGHQILSIACGAVTSRLKFGHHGCNHPVKNLLNESVEITSQNHNFAVTPESIKNTQLEVTHINLNDMSVEGMRHKTEPLFAVQYHPEAAPGPHDPSYLFKNFKTLMSR